MITNSFRYLGSSNYIAENKKIENMIPNTENIEES